MVWEVGRVPDILEKTEKKNIVGIYFVGRRVQIVGWLNKRLDLAGTLDNDGSTSAETAENDVTESYD